MSKKKIYMATTATAAITAALFGADKVDAATHEVKSGDTLWSLAQKYDTSVAKLKELNNLSSDLIIINDILEVGNGKGQASKSESKTSSNKTSSSNTSGTYTVVSGDTLYKIANKHNMTVQALMDANNLSSSMIYPGDKLSVSGSSSSNSSSSSSSSNSSSNTTSNNSSSTSSNSSNNSSSSTTSTTYTIKSGDTLGQIAADHKVSVDQLKSWNNLSSHLIFPGDKLSINGNSSSSSSSSSSSNSSNSTSSSKDGSSNNSSSSSSSSSSTSSSSSATTTYTVKKGDSLSKIASNHGISVNKLMSWNNLSSTLIFPGDKLALKEGVKSSSSNNSSSSSSSSSSSNTSSNSSSSSSSSSSSNASSSKIDTSSLISTAKSVQGTPYVWGGSQPGGFDCSGFITWAFNTSGTKSIGRMSVAGYDTRSYQVSNPQVGDLVFFKGTYGGPNHMSHMGIYLGGGNFIHASSSQGVSIANVNNSYWSKYFDSYKRFY